MFFIFFPLPQTFMLWGILSWSKTKCWHFKWIGKSCIQAASGYVKNWALHCSQAHLFPLIPTYVLHANPLWWRALFLSPGNHRHSPVLLNRIPGFKGNALKLPRMNKYQYWTGSEEVKTLQPKSRVGRGIFRKPSRTFIACFLIVSLCFGIRVQTEISVSSQIISPNVN